MSLEKKEPSSLRVISEDLGVDPESLYKKVLRVCKLEANSNVYDEYTTGHLRNTHSNFKASLGEEERDFLIEGFSFLGQSEDVIIAILLRDLTDADYSGTREFLSPDEVPNFKDFEDKIMKGERPAAMIEPKVHMTYESEDDFHTHDYFFPLYPVYLEISDPDMIQEIEDVVSRIEGREVVPV